uniref:Uncharacterized protein n=1 Tax=Anguilla anguilla TaxID=7936 RepID=A0A0E9PH25_ANGAN
MLQDFEGIDEPVGQLPGLHLEGKITGRQPYLLHRTVECNRVTLMVGLVLVSG